MSSMQRVDQIASHLMPPAAAGLKFRVSNGVAEITLANERQRNPLSYATLKALEEILLSINPGWKYSEDWVGVGSMPEKPTKEQLDRQGDLGKNLAKQGVNLDIGVVVIRAEGPIFSSGHNLKEFSRSVPEQRVSR